MRVGLLKTCCEVNGCVCVGGAGGGVSCLLLRFLFYFFILLAFYVGRP